MPGVSLALSVLTAPFTGGLSLAAGALKGFTGAVKFTMGILKGLWRRVRLIALAATAALIGLIYQAAAFQKQMSFVSTMVKDTTKWMGKLTKGVKQMSISFGQSTRGMTTALYDILSASVPVEKSMEVLRVASMAAVAGFTDVTQVGKTLTSVMNGMGISFDQAQKVADVMFRTVEKGQLTFNQLQGSMARAMVAARTARVPFEELAASYAFLTRRGFNVAMAETAVAMALTKMMVPTEASKKAAKEYGIELGETALATKGLIGTIEDLAKAGLTAEQLKKLFPNIRAQRAISAMIKSSKEFRGDVEAMYQSAGAQGRAFAKATETLSFQWSKFISTMKIVLIDLITPMLPALQTMFKRLSMIGEYLRKEISIDLASSISGFTKKVTGWIESLIFWLMQEIPYIFQRVKGYILLITKFVQTALDVGVLKTLLGMLWTYITNYYENLFRITTGLWRAIGERLYQTVRWAWWKVRSFVTGEAMPEFINEFTGLLDYVELEFTNRMPDAFKKGFAKAEKWYEEYRKKIDKEYEDRKNKLAKLREKFNEADLKSDKDLAEGASKITHGFESEKLLVKKKTSKEIIEDEIKKLDHIKALGELSLQEEARRLRKLVSIAQEGTEERMKLEKRLYDVEKQIRSDRRKLAFEHFDMMELEERQSYLTKIKFLRDFLKNEKLSYKERKEIFLEIRKLQDELRNHEREEQKKLNEFYMDSTWKRLKEQENMLKKRKFLLGKDAVTRRKINQALERNQREQAKRRWDFISKLRVQDRKESVLEGLRKLKIAERHIMESIKKDKLSNKEKAKAQIQLDKVRKDIGKARERALKKENVKASELSEKERQWNKKLEKDIAKLSGQRVDKELQKEKDAQTRRVEQAKEYKKEVEVITDKAKEKVKELSVAMYDSLSSAIKAIISELGNLEKMLISVFEKMIQLCKQAKICGLPIPAMGIAQRKALAARPGLPAGKAIQEIKVGPIYVGQIDSTVDAIRTAELIGKELADSVQRDFRQV